MNTSVITLYSVLLTCIRTPTGERWTNTRERWGPIYEIRRRILDTKEKAHMQGTSVGQKEGISPAIALVLCSPSTAIRKDIYSPQQFSSSPTSRFTDWDSSSVSLNLCKAWDFVQENVLLPLKKYKVPCVLWKLLIDSIQPLLYFRPIVLYLSPVLVLAICSFKNKIQRMKLS